MYKGYSYNMETSYTYFLQLKWVNSSGGQVVKKRSNVEILVWQTR